MLICLPFSLSPSKAEKTVKAFHKSIQYILCMQADIKEGG